MQKTVRHWWNKSKMTYSYGEIHHILGLKESILWKWLYCPKQSIDSMQFWSNLQWYFPQSKDKNFLQFVWKNKRPWIAKAISRKENRAERINLHDFRLYYKATVIKIMWHWHKNSNINQGNKRESPEISLHFYGDLISDKEGKNIQRRKDSLLNKWL